MENPMNKWMIWGYHYFWKHPFRVNVGKYTSPMDPMGHVVKLYTPRKLIWRLLENPTIFNKKYIDSFTVDVPFVMLVLGGYTLK